MFAFAEMVVVVDGAFLEGLCIHEQALWAFYEECKESQAAALSLIRMAMHTHGHPGAMWDVYRQRKVDADAAYEAYKAAVAYRHLFDS